MCGRKWISGRVEAGDPRQTGRDHAQDVIEISASPTATPAADRPTSLSWLLGLPSPILPARAVFDQRVIEVGASSRNISLRDRRCLGRLSHEMQ